MARYVIKYIESSKKPYQVFDNEAGVIVSKHSWKRFAVEAIEKLNGF